MKCSLLSFVLAGAVALAPLAVWADPSADAKAHFKAGAELYKSAQYQEAIVEFQAAYDLRPAGVLHYNIAQCYEKLGNIPSALRSYHNYLRETPNADDRATTEAAISHLEKRLAESGVQQVLVYSDPSNASVTIDGKPAGSTPMAVQLPPGPHTVGVSKDGYAPAQQQVVVTVDKSVELSVGLQKGSGAPLVIAADPTTPPSTSSATSTPAGGLAASQAPPAAEKSPTRVWTWVAAGTAGAALATGIVLGVGAQSNAATLTNGTVRDGAGNQGWASRAQNEALGANIAYGVAGVAAITSIALFFYEGRN